MLLFLVLIALAGCAALGVMMAVVVGSGESLWGLVEMTFVTAVATGLLLPLTFLIDRPRVLRGAGRGERSRAAEVAAAPASPGQSPAPAAS